MLVDRRGFLKDIFLLCAAPAIITINRLMPVKPIITGEELLAFPFRSPILHLWNKRLLKEFYHKTIFETIQDGYIKIYSGKWPNINEEIDESRLILSSAFKDFNMAHIKNIKRAFV